MCGDGIQVGNNLKDYICIEDGEVDPVSFFLACLFER